MLVRIAAALLLLPTLRVTASAQKTPAVWTIDKTHSNVGFQIRHFVSRVPGRFKEVKGTISADPDSWQNAAIEVEIQTASVSTNNDGRDADLRSNNFFAADSFPVITFRSTKVERSGDDAKIYGDLTIRGVTKAVVLDGHYNGIQPGSRLERVGFDATTTINRLDFGVKWNRAVEGGGVMLGDEVKIEINVEAVHQKG